MKKHLLPVLSILALSVLAFVACTTTVTDPTTGETKKVADTNFIHKVAAEVAALNASTAPVNPYAPVIAPTIPIGAAISLGVSTLWASFLNWRNKKALTAVVKGVEEFSAASPKGGLKDLIFDQSKELGVAGHLAEVVESLTKTPPTK